jgi:hypothetical protein
MSKSVTYNCAVETGDMMSAIPVPFDPKSQFGKVRAPVIVTIGDFSYRSTISKMGGSCWVPLRKSNREGAGLIPGQQIEVTLTLDEAARTVELPHDFAAALAAIPEGAQAWEGASYTHRREYIEAISEAKRPETRAKRLDLAIAYVKSRISR